MLVLFHRSDGCDGVRMVRRTDSHGVNLIAHFLEHFAEVDKGLGLRDSLRFLGELVFVDIDQGNHVTEAIGIICVAGTFTANTDTGEVQFFVLEARVIGLGSSGDKQSRPESGCGCSFEDIAARGQGVEHGRSLFERYGISEVTEIKAVTCILFDWFLDYKASNP